MTIIHKKTSMPINIISMYQVCYQKKKNKEEYIYNFKEEKE